MDDSDVLYFCNFLKGFCRTGEWKGHHILLKDSVIDDLYKRWKEHKKLVEMIARGFDESEEEDSHVKPDYYNRGGIECREVIRAWDLNFNLGNTLKYICRAGLKESREEDLKKAVQYLQFELEETSGNAE